MRHPATDTYDPELQPSNFSIAIVTLHEPMPTSFCMNLAAGASVRVPKDQTHPQQ